MLKPKNPKDKKIRPPTIRIDDKVMIVIPEFFVRVGFPLQMSDILDDDIDDDIDDHFIGYHPSYSTTGFPTASGKEGVRTDLDKRISNFLYDATAPWYNNGKIDSVIHNKLLKLLAYGVLQARDFGGKERKIFTSSDFNYVYYFPVGSIATVMGKKIVRTGIYENHRIEGRNNVILSIRNDRNGANNWIEAKNVRLLKRPELALLNEL